MNDHISKPIDPANLFETVGRFYKPAENAASPAIAESKQTDVRHAGLGDLPSVEGLDTKDGLPRVGGNRKLYLKLLRQFVEQQGQAPAQIAEALARNEVPVAERLAHTVKGVAAVSALARCSRRRAGWRRPSLQEFLLRNLCQYCKSSARFCMTSSAVSMPHCRGQ